MKPFSAIYWRRVLAKEWFPMLISVGLAVSLWYFVGGEQTVDKNVQIPVEVINLPRHLVISNQFKKEIEVTVNGPRSLIFEIDNKQITRQIDLSKATPGTTVISNDLSSIPVPRGITVLRVQPATIILSLDKLIQKRFAINPVTAGTLPPGYILQGLRMDPDDITITGPETVLSNYDVLRTKVININGLRSSVQQQVPLDLEPAIVDLIGETTITADISVGLETEQREFTLPLATSAAYGLKKKVDKVKVLANVPILLLQQRVNIPAQLSAAIVVDAERGVGVVQIVPAPELALPVEIIKVEPATVPLAGRTPLADQVSETVPGKTEGAAAPGSANQPVENQNR